MADSKWAAAAIVKTETDAIREHYYPAAAAHLPTNGAAALFSGKDNTNRKQGHLPFLTLPHGDGDAGFQPFTITASAPSSESSKQSNGNRALSLLSDNHTLMTVPTAQPLGGAAVQYGNGADVSLTGMYYASVGGKQTSSILATAGGQHTAAAAAAVTAAHGAQMQYHHGHGYYPTVSGGDGSQSNPDSAAIHQAIPFSSW